ncbi:MAG TPA: alpha/beta hydrolase-fold protein [Niabella sp.]|nr:esterase family protein [Chitinophagaceae bacterium]HRO83793.1 alpha/beta hydrolase-fold protein [Niabella sp.]
MNRILFSSAFFLLFLSNFCFASKVDTLETISPSMNKIIKAVVITPDNYNKNNAYPVFYLLHGYSGNYSNWVKAKAVIDAADRYQMIIVCPDGGYGSWYWDSPVDEEFKYETYISKELISWIDEKYATIASPKGRAIAGLSMGGHGALYLAIKHPDIFGAAGSMSGGVDIRPFPNNWEIAKRLGKYSEYPDRWEDYTVMNMLHLIEPNSLKIIIDCGTQDIFFKVNEELHKEMLYYNIPHDYISRPGGHNWQYWENAVAYQALFMNQFFREAQEAAMKKISSN